MSDIDKEVQVLTVIQKIEDFTKCLPQHVKKWPSDTHQMIISYMEVLDSYLDDREVVDSSLTPSGVPYCGCSECQVREVTVLATILTIQGVREGKVRLGDG